MQAFKTALHIILRHPVYLLLYAVFLSGLGVFITSSLNGEGESGSFTASVVPIAVIDHDGSEISQSLTSFLGESGQLVDVPDDTFAKQDAVATGEVGYLLVIPAGFGDAYLTAAREDTSEPVLESTFGYASVAGSLVDEQVNQYLGLVRAAAILEPGATTASVLERADASIGASASVETMQTPKSTTPVDRFAFYLQWGTYTLTAAIIVCIGVVMSAFNRTDVRRRNLTAPVPNLSLGLQKAAACLVTAVIVWAFSCGIGLIAFGPSMQGVPLLTIALLLGAALVFSLVPLSVGFLLGQIGVSEMAANAVGNISGMVMSFLGGAWISYDLLAPEVQTIAHFVPTFWYTDAVNQVAHLETMTIESLTPYLTDLGIVLLFAIALFAIALATGRIRMRSAESGGNAAASVAA